MDIDHRLDELTERHEALAQTLELVVHMQQQNEGDLQRNEALLEKSQILIVHVIESVDCLARIAQSARSASRGLRMDGNRLNDARMRLLKQTNGFSTTSRSRTIRFSPSSA